MDDSRKFLSKNKEKIHDLLNHMWRTIEQIAIRLETDLPNSDLDNTHGNFIKIKEGWSEATYPNPAVVFPYGELGYSFDGLYCVFTVLAEKVTEHLLVTIIELSQESNEITYEIYGGDDCFTTYLNSQDELDLEDVLRNISSTEEQILQIDTSILVTFDEEVKELFLGQIKRLYLYLEENDALSSIQPYIKNIEEEE